LIATKRGTIPVNNYNYGADIPIRCPYCSAYVEPHIEEVRSLNYNGKILETITFKVNCCSKLFFANYEFDTSLKKTTLLTVNPPAQPEPLPDEIVKMSPRFAELYKQAHFAEQQNYYELAGSGYRNALEVLVKDFAIKELNKPEHEVAKKKLYDAIGDYVPSVAVTAADVVRVLGNDYTHYERKYDDIDFEVLKKYLRIFINAIENELLIRHPIVNTNRQ